VLHVALHTGSLLLAVLVLLQILLGFPVAYVIFRKVGLTLRHPPQDAVQHEGVQVLGGERVLALTSGRRCWATSG
jgi:hypothetical protein